MCDSSYSDNKDTKKTSRDREGIGMQPGGGYDPFIFCLNQNKQTMNEQCNAEQKVVTYQPRLKMSNSKEEYNIIAGAATWLLKIYASSN